MLLIKRVAHHHSLITSTLGPSLCMGEIIHSLVDLKKNGKRIKMEQTGFTLFFVHTSETWGETSFVTGKVFQLLTFFVVAFISFRNSFSRWPKLSFAKAWKRSRKSAPDNEARKLSRSSSSPSPDNGSVCIAKLFFLLGKGCVYHSRLLPGKREKQQVVGSYTFLLLCRPCFLPTSQPTAAEMKKWKERALPSHFSVIFLHDLEKLFDALVVVLLLHSKTV